MLVTVSIVDKFVMLAVTIQIMSSRSLWEMVVCEPTDFLATAVLVTRLKCINIGQNEMHLFLNIREQSLTWV